MLDTARRQTCWCRRSTRGRRTRGGCCSGSFRRQGPGGGAGVWLGEADAKFVAISLDLAAHQPTSFTPLFSLDEKEVGEEKYFPTRPRSGDFFEAHPAAAQPDRVGKLATWQGPGGATLTAWLDLRSTERRSGGRRWRRDCGDRASAAPGGRIATTVPASPTRGRWAIGRKDRNSGLTNPNEPGGCSLRRRLRAARPDGATTPGNRNADAPFSLLYSVVTS